MIILNIKQVALFVHAYGTSLNLYTEILYVNLHEFAYYNILILEIFSFRFHERHDFNVRLGYTEDQHDRWAMFVGENLRIS